LTWKNQQRSISALMLLCAAVSRRLSVIVPHTCRGLNEVPAGVPTKRQVPIPGFVDVVRVVPRSADSLRLPCVATPSAGKREPGEETRGRRSEDSQGVRGEARRAEQPRPPADLPVCSRYGTGWTYTGCSGTPTPSRCSALIQGGKPYPGRMLTPEPLEPVNDWQTALAVVAHPDELVFDRAAAVARWTSRASTSCTAC